MIFNNIVGPDRRKRCSVCGQVYLKDHGFLKWLTNTYTGILLIAISSVPLVMFIIGTLVLWIMAGNSFSEGGDGYYQHTLVTCIRLNLEWVWNLIAHRIV